MLQNEQEYIRILRNRLEGTLPKDELDDILSDYSEHFSIGKANGRTDEELWRSLGSPEDVAREIRVMHLVKKAGERAVVQEYLPRGHRNARAGPLQPRLCPGTVHPPGGHAPRGLHHRGDLCDLRTCCIHLLGSPARGSSVICRLALAPCRGIHLHRDDLASGSCLIIGDYYLARFFYHAGIQYLKWNIGVITGTERAA